MKRQITIYESAKNGKITVFDDVECNTLGELKTLLREKGINYNSKEFVEGVTNTKLLSDDSRIPTNIPFKGQTTNDVFINILNKDTKIKSGINYAELSRGDLLRAAKPYAEEIQNKFNANYTRVKSADIAAFLESKNKPSEPKKDAVEQGSEEKCVCDTEKKLEMLKEAVEYLTEELGNDDDRDVITGIFKNWSSKEEKEIPEVKPEPKSNFSDEDIRSFIRR